MDLTPTQQNALQRVTEADRALRAKKAELTEKYRQIMEAELAESEMALTVQVRQAHRMDVPKRQIGLAMGTTNFRSVQNRIDETLYKGLLYTNSQQRNK